MVTFLMVGQGARARKNVSVWLKRVALRWKNSKANFLFLERIFPFPRSGLSNLATLGQTTVRSRKRKVLSRKRKSGLDLFLSGIYLFPALQNIYSLFCSYLSRVYLHNYLDIHICLSLRRPALSRPTSDFYHVQSSRSPVRPLLSKAKPSYVYSISKPYGWSSRSSVEPLLREVKPSYVYSI